MKHITCFIDASSYINLSNLEFFQGNLLELLDKTIILRYCSEVNFEISKHSTPNMPDALKRSSKVYRYTTYTNDDYELKFFDNVRTRAQGDKGERDNLLAAFDFYFQEKQAITVFLTDDLSALKNHLGTVLNSFPFLKIWTSFDAILFLYINKKLPTSEIAKNVLNNLNSVIATDNVMMDHEKTEARIKRRKQYTTFIERVFKILN